MIPSSQSVSRFAFGEPNRSKLRSCQTFALAKAILVERSSCWAPKGPITGAQPLDLFASTGRSELLLGPEWPTGARAGPLLAQPNAEHDPALVPERLAQPGLSFSSAKVIVPPRLKGYLSGFQGTPKAERSSCRLCVAKQNCPGEARNPTNPELPDGFASQTLNRVLAQTLLRKATTFGQPLGQPSYAQLSGRANSAGGRLVRVLSRPPALFAEQAKVAFRASFSRAQLGRPEGPRGRFMVNSYKDGIDPTTDEPLNTEVAMRPLVGVSNQPELGRQLSNKADEQETRTIVITSGKGGVGKTTTTANLGMSIARLGYRVALIDADIGLRNLDLLLGLENRVLYTAMDIFEGDCRLDQALIRDKRLKNLCLLAISKNRQRYNVTRQKMDTLIASISALGYHFILIDCPAGIDIGFINAISPAQEALIVTTPEITAMRDADRVAGLLEANGIYNAKLLINRVRPDMIQRHDMMSVQDVQDVLGIPLLGAIPEDLNVIISTNRGEPLVLRKKLTLSGIAFENAARRLIGRSDYLIDLKTPYKGLFQKMKTLFFNNQ